MFEAIANLLHVPVDVVTAGAAFLAALLAWKGGKRKGTKEGQNG